MSRSRVFILSSGLGHVPRGVEAVLRECYHAVADDPDLEVHLFKGGGRTGGGETRLRSLSRNSRLARTIAMLFGRGGYFIEQLTFFLSLLPHLIRRRPDVVYVADLVLSNLLRLPRRCLGFAIVFHNGGATYTRFLNRYQHIHQLSPAYYDVAVAEGCPPERQTVLPCGVDIPVSFSATSPQEREQLRSRLGLPQNVRLILSVAAINRSSKRIDYLISEVAALPEPRPFLLVLGAWEEASDSLVEQGHRELPGGFEARSVAKDAVSDYYRAADVFVLASLREGFGLVQVEALAYGLPCLVHDYPTSRYVLADMGFYGDFSQAGGLTQLLAGLESSAFINEKALLRHAYAYERFGWDRLKADYVTMFRRCAGDIV